MKIYNNISNNITNAYKNRNNSPSFKAKTLVIKNLPNTALKLASLAIASANIAGLAMSRNKAIREETSQQPIIHDIEPAATPVKQEPIVTPPAQLSLFHMHDFHGQTVRMERAHSAGKAFDEGKIGSDSSILEDTLPTDRLKLCSGDMFLGADNERGAIVNEFLNKIGIVATALGNHECDATLSDFAQNVKDKNYRLVGTNIHPDKTNPITGVVSNSFIVEINGNKYGIIGASPVDFMKHTARPEEIEKLKLDDMKTTISEIKADIETIRQNGANKIILLSHMGYDFDKLVAEHVEGIDIILGGHTHTLFTEVKEGENLIYSPNGEPVLIVQSGRDGEYIGTPIVKFNELGQITEIDYSVIRTDDYKRSKEIQNSFDKILGKAEKLGVINKVAETPTDIYANENPNCNFMLDCLRSELDTDIAIMNSASIRNKFVSGNLSSRDLEDISPFTDKIVVIEATEKEIVNAIQLKAKETMNNPNHRPGLLQVSGLRYEFDNSGNIINMSFINKAGEEVSINVQNPSDKKYTIAVNQYCAGDPNCGLGLKHRVDSAIQRFDKDIKDFVSSWIKKQNGPIEIIADERIKEA